MYYGRGCNLQTDEIAEMGRLRKRIAGDRGKEKKSRDQPMSSSPPILCSGLR